MPSQHAFHHTYSISRRLTICLVVMAAIVALGTVAIFYLKTDAQTEEELRKRADEMTEYLARILEISLWNLNLENLTTISDIFAQNAVVASIVVTDSSGKILYVYHDERWVVWTERMRPIQYQGHTLGHVRLTFTKQPAQRARYALLRAMMITSGMILLVLGGGSGLLVRIFLRKPLQRLNAIVSAYAEGKYTAFEDTLLPYLEFQPFGHVLKRMGVTISEQMRQLQENEVRYCKAQAMGHVGNWEYNLQTTHFWGSDEAKRIYGFDPAQSDFSTEAVENCIPERERVHQALLDLIEAEKPYHLEFETHPKDCSAPRIIVSIAELLRDEHGTPLKVVGVIQDITERKRAEEALRESEERFRFVLNNSLDAAYRRNLLIDRYDYISPVVEHVLGWSVAEMNEMSTDTVLRLIYPDDVPGIARELERMTAECQAVGRATGTLEYRFCHKNSEYRWVGDTITVLADANNRPLYRLGILRDITERKRAEEQIRAHNRLLEEAVQQKQREMEALFERMLRQEKLATIGQVSGSIAHELRNSLGAIKQAIYYLKQLARRQRLTADNPKVLRHLDIMDTELNTSERVIADLLEITRMKTPKRQSTDLRTLLTDAINRCQLSPQVRVVITLTPDPIEISVDPLQLRQVFLNVLMNAAQAIEGDGAISIRATQSPESGETSLEIADTGVGLTSEALQKVFEPLYTTKTTGTGLGLSICKQIMDSHQGRISLTSLPGQGTTVTLVIP